MSITEMTDFDNTRQLCEMADQLNSFVKQAAIDGTEAHVAEEGILQFVRAIGRQALGLFFDMQGDGDVGETVTTEEGRTMRRLDKIRHRKYHSIFGVFTLSRYAYGSREGQQIELVPLDARIAMPESDFSYLLQDWAGAITVEHAFAQTAHILEEILGTTLHVDSLERMNRKMSESVEEFRDSLKNPPPEQEGEILVATADGKGVPMRRPADQRPTGARRKKGEKANKKQMATLGAVYTVDAKHRTAEDVVESLFRERKPDRPNDSHEPKAKHKRVRSSLTYEMDGVYVDAETEVFTWMQREVDQRRRDGQPIVCIMDGQRSLWTSCAEHLSCGNVVEILDLLHAISYLWDAAYLFHKEGSKEATAFVRDRALRILQGGAGRVIGGLRQMATKHCLKKNDLKQMNRICNYLENNRSRMRYDEYLDAGYPIASGVIEGACRHLVKDRMERSGMRWTIDGAQAMLDLRSTAINGQWSDFVVHRIQTEIRRLYPSRQQVKQLAFHLST